MAHAIAVAGALHGLGTQGLRQAKEERRSGLKSARNSDGSCPQAMDLGRRSALAAQGGAHWQHDLRGCRTERVRPLLHQRLGMGGGQHGGAGANPARRRKALCFGFIVVRGPERILGHCEIVFRQSGVTGHREKLLAVRGVSGQLLWACLTMDPKIPIEQTLDSSWAIVSDRSIAAHEQTSHRCALHPPFPPPLAPAGPHPRPRRGRGLEAVARAAAHECVARAGFPERLHEEQLEL